MTHVPKVIFKTRVRNEALGGSNPFEWKDLSTDEIFKGKKKSLTTTKIRRKYQKLIELQIMCWQQK